MRLAGEDPVEEKGEEHGEPYYRGEEWDDPDPADGTEHCRATGCSRLYSGAGLSRRVGSKLTEWWTWSGRAWCRGRRKGLWPKGWYDTCFVVGVEVSRRGCDDMQRRGCGVTSAQSGTGLACDPLTGR
jgi:hypothetical protein